MPRKRRKFPRFRKGRNQFGHLCEHATGFNIMCQPCFLFVQARISRNLPIDRMYK